MVARETIVAIALALVMVTAAGCAGLGTDEPADSPDSGQDDNLEETNGETQTDDGTESDAGEESDNSGAGTENGSDDGNDSESDTDAEENTDSVDDDENESSDADDNDSGASDSDGDNETSGDNGETDDDESSNGDDSNADEDESDEHGTLTITVENESGEPVEDMLVTGTGPNDQQHDGRTDENGQVTFDLPDGDYSWVTDTEGTGYEGDEASVTMDGTDESITMTVTPRTSDLTATVTDHDGNPLSDATVSVVADPGTDGGEDIDSATTNESGVAEFEVERGTYEISASHEEYSTDGTAGPIDVTQEGENIDVTMPEPDDDGTETYTLTVRTPSAPDGTAITVQREAGSDEEEPDPITKVSAGGQASFNVPPGHYHAEAEEYNPTMVAVEVSDDREITLQQPDPDPIEVTVVDAETDEPIEGAEISGICQLWHSSGDVYVEGTTDANGLAQAQADVAPTECDARVEADGYETTHLALSVPDDDGITVEITPADDEGADTSADDDSETAVLALAP